MRNAVRAGEIDLRDKPFRRHVLLKVWNKLGAAFQGFFVARGLSSSLWLVTRQQELA